LKKKRYKKFPHVEPSHLQPVEYVIEVTVMGWYSPTTDSHTFIADERLMPQATVTKWRRRDAEPYEEAEPKIRAFREGVYEKVD